MLLVSEGIQAQDVMDCDSIYAPNSLDEEPKFEEGYAKGLRWITENLDYPSDAAMEIAETGNVLVFVLIDRTGVIQSVTIEGENAIQNLHELRDSMPTITPAMANGKPVCSQMRFSMNILLD